jgi:thiamine biosynthesis lipoprotein
VSAVWGKSFDTKGKTYGHVIDPRTGYPADDADLAAVVLPSATETDALSTALLTVGPKHHDRIASLRPKIRTLVMKRHRTTKRPLVKSQNLEVL